MTTRPAPQLAARFLLLAGLLVACSSEDGAAPPGAPASSERLQTDTGVTWTIELDEITQTARLAYPDQPTAPILRAGTDPATAARDFLLHYPEVFGASTADQLEPVGSTQDADDGSIHVRLQQRALGVVVPEAELLVHFDPQGGIDHVSGPFYPQLAELAATPIQIPLEDAKKVAVDALRARLGREAEIDEATTLLRLDEPGDAFRLVHEVALLVGEEPWTVQVDVESGQVVAGFSSDVHRAASGRGILTSRSFTIDEPEGGEFNLRRAGALAMFSWPSMAAITSKSATSWETSVAAANKGVAVETFYKFGLTADWFRKTLGWSSWDNKGTAIPVLVYDEQLAGNACYSSKRKLFGGRKNEHFRVGPGADGKYALVDIDTIAHEFTHGVVAHTAKLRANGEPAAINESLADIFGEFVQEGTLGGDRSESGDEFGSKYVIRSMKNPMRTGGTDEYGNKSGDAHTDAGIGNLAWWLMTAGGKHPTNGMEIKFVALGMPKSRQLWWRVLRSELSAGSKYKDLAKRSILAARALKLPIEPVTCAWTAVGVIDADEAKKKYGVDCKAVTESKDSCAGRGDGLYCSEIDKRSAFECKNQQRLSAQFCPSGQNCKGPNGRGSLQCGK